MIIAFLFSLVWFILTWCRDFFNKKGFIVVWDNYIIYAWETKEEQKN